MQNLRELPKLRDSLSYLYLEHGRVEQKYKAVDFVDKTGGVTPIPAAALSVLLLGPGTTITHAAIKSLADNGCLIIWAGEAIFWIIPTHYPTRRPLKNRWLSNCEPTLVKLSIACVNPPLNPSLASSKKSSAFASFLCGACSLPVANGPWSLSPTT